MKRILQSLFILLLCGSMIFTTACGSNAGDASNTDGSAKSQNGKYIYTNGYCDYVLLIPENANSYEISAKDEFIALFSEATSYSMPVVTDDQPIPEGKRCISLGNTTAFRESGISATEEELGYSGYKIITKNENVYIVGDVERNCPGVLYGVYGLLAECFNFKAYSAECYRLDKSAKVPLVEWNITDVPDIDMRSLGFLDLNQNAQYANRMRLQQWNGSMTSNEWVTNGHSMLESLLPARNYVTEHPDWYFNVGSYGYTLCMTKDEIVEAMAERVKTELEKNTIAEYFMLGQSDTNASCQCETCLKRVAELGGSFSAVQLEFINKVSDIVTPWLEETQPGREMTFYTFAYWWSLNPPGVDENGKRYVYANDNVGIMFAPLNMDYRYPVASSRNAQYNEALTGWTEVTNHLTVYYYPISFHNYLVPFNDFGSLTENVRQLVDMGCEYYYTQGPANDSRGAAMQDLKVYVLSQLLWDSTLNMNDLVKEFHTYYFDTAAESMQMYYELTRSWYEADINGALVDTGLCGVSWATEEAYPKDFVEGLYAVLDQALADIECYKTTNPELYEQLYWRIEKERLTVTYIDLRNYTAFYSSEEIYQMASHFKETIEYFGISKTLETETVAAFLQPFLN